MKRFLSLTAIITLFAFTSIKFDNEKATAIVNQEHGLYIFVDSKPTKDYELLETIVSKNGNLDLKSFQQYALTYDQLKEEVFRTIDKKKNRDKFKGAEAIIIYPNRQMTDVIKFK